MEQDGVRVQDDVVDKHAAQRDAEQAEFPAIFLLAVEIQVFQHEDVGDRDAHPGQQPERETGGHFFRQGIRQRGCGDEQRGEQPDHDQELAACLRDAQAAAVEDHEEAVPRHAARQHEPAGQVFLCPAPPVATPLAEPSDGSGPKRRGHAGEGQQLPEGAAS